VNGVDPTGITENSLVWTNKRIPFSKLHDDMLAFDERAGYCYSLNDSAARIWTLIENPISVGDICVVLTKEFSVDKETCVKDVSELLIALRDAYLIEVEGAPPVQAR
jgi:hypothetical protein